MRKPRIIAQHDFPSMETRVLCQPSPAISPAVEVRVEYSHGGHRDALRVLQDAYYDAKAQILAASEVEYVPPMQEGSDD